MPLFVEGGHRGYDLDLELPFAVIQGEKIAIGSAGSIIMVCSICGEEHFRDQVSEHETCFEGHGQMQPMRLADGAKYEAIWKARGDHVTTVEERRADRLKREAEKPWLWQFGGKTEADFPRGYVEKNDRRFH